MKVNQTGSIEVNEFKIVSLSRTVYILRKELLCSVFRELRKGFSMPYSEIIFMIEMDYISSVGCLVLHFNLGIEFSELKSANSRINTKCNPTVLISKSLRDFQFPSGNIPSIVKPRELHHVTIC